jgi:hypothetical protein
MSVNSEEIVLTNNASKFEALLYQFVKLYDRLTLEHSLMNERELKLIKNLEGFNETIKELNNSIINTNNALVEINNLDLKLAVVVHDNVTTKFEEACRSLNEIGSQVSTIIEETNIDTVDQVWIKLSRLIEKSIKQALSENLDFHNRALRETTNKFEEFIKEANQLGMKNLFLWLGFILLIGVILGMVLKHYVF